MTDHVYQKFPNHIKVIQSLLQQDATFREICADYEEMCTWLVSQSCREGRSTAECDRARDLIRDLENDISKVLREAGY